MPTRTSAGRTTMKMPTKRKEMKRRRKKRKMKRTTRTTRMRTKMTMTKKKRRRPPRSLLYRANRPRSLHWLLLALGFASGARIALIWCRL